MEASPLASSVRFGKRCHPHPRPVLRWVTYRRNRLWTKRCRPRQAWLALGCRTEWAHPVPRGGPLSPHSCGLLGARRDGTDCRRCRMVCGAVLAGTLAMACVPLLGLRRCTKCRPRKSNPSGTRVTRGLSRLRVQAIRWAIPAKAVRAA